MMIKSLRLVWDWRQSNTCQESFLSKTLYNQSHVTWRGGGRYQETVSLLEETL